MDIDSDQLMGHKDKTIKLMREGKIDEAIESLDLVHEQSRYTHDFAIDWISACYGKLAEAYGEEWLVEFNRDVFFEYLIPRFEAYKDMTPLERLKITMDAFRTNFHEFEVEEDDEKYILKITGCNNGGRLIRDGLARRHNALTKEGHGWSFGQVGFPYYCIHANHFMEVWRKFGIRIEIVWGKQYDDNGNKIDDPCTYLIYK